MTKPTPTPLSREELFELTGHDGSDCEKCGDFCCNCELCDCCVRANMSEVMEKVDRHIADTLKAFADEVERVIGEDDDVPEYKNGTISESNYHTLGILVGRNNLRRGQHKALKDLREKWGIE